MGRRWTGLLLTGLAAVGTLTWWRAARSEPEGTLDRARREGVLRVGYAVEAPYSFLDARGQLTGTEVEVAKQVVRELGIPRIEWRQTGFGSLLDELEAERFDAVVAGMFITPERAERASFSEPTFRVRQALLVPAGNPHGIHSYEDAARRPALKIAVLHGSIEEELVRRAGVPEARITVVPDALTGRVAVESGLVGGLALSLPAVRFLASQHQLGLTEVAQPFAPPAGSEDRRVGYGAVVFRKEDAALRANWNRELSKLIGSTEHHRLLGRFGFGADERPVGVSTAEILEAGAP